MIDRDAALRSLQSVVPPSLWQLLRSRFGNRFEGDFPSWAEARAVCSGYDDTAIVARIAEGVRAVKSGRAAGERDGVLFDEPICSWPALASLLLIACGRGGRLSVVDFGGSLGTSYRQNQRYLSQLQEVRWVVVEQAAFVAAGRSEFQDEQLEFSTDLDEAISQREPDVILLSGVLQYLPEPQKFLEELLKKPVEYLLFDRTPLIAGDRDRLTVQRVPAHINAASYPAWFFARAPFMSTLSAHFDLVAEFAAPERVNIPAKYIGALWRRRQS